MKGEWCYYNKLLKKEQCESIVSICKQESMYDARVGISPELDTATRRSKICFLDKNRHNELYNFLWPRALEANRNFFEFNLQDCEEIQFTEYSSEYQGEYKPHIDTFWLSPKQRKMSAILQLSDPDDYEGGDFVIESSELPNYEEVRNQGTLLFFPSFFKHGVMPVTKGIRHSLVIWFTGPHFT